MMKKLIVYTGLALSLNAQAQFVRGIGIFGAGTMSAHNYLNKDYATRYEVPYDPAHFYPSTHASTEYFSWGAGVLAELLPYDNLRWQTELEYVNKGAKEREIIDLYSGDRTDSKSVNKYTYIQWNNFLKFYYPIFSFSHTYLLSGLRLEYLYNSSASVFRPVSNSFPKIWFSGNVGVGYEFPLFKTFTGFSEFHWNPDIIRHKHGNTGVRNRTYELRVGIMWRKRVRRIDDCNAPKYHGPNY